MPDDQSAQKLVGLYEGPVVDNKDPMKLGRVKVRIPGVANPTTWAFPLGWGGAKQHGTWEPPPIGAEVGVMFKMGDPDHPRYILGYPGQGETPDEVQQGTVEEALQVPFVREGTRWKIVMDERPNSARIALYDKITEDVIEIDGVNLGVHFKATSALSIECDGAVDIRGSSVTINGRKVAPSTKAI